ncbi:hypothetical conserved protein [Candidatus Nitrosoglobus terrae]|uniref:Hypothetical conserved protein n=1 Tax=Candidatus Nitrosoglobus terrae TaxID=1630141 RepID=A0A1Q2SNU2_9GAMM|nr:hypothetical protein [Candidatus Nitrosoglobus terrae]BAW80806.1 hypothetical conserved protein [Candidatus Nitrosoglobus terrae]
MLSRSLSQHLTIVVPGLAQALAVEDSAGLRLSFLERLIGRANLIGSAAAPYESLLFKLFNISQLESTDIPVAPIMYAWDKGNSLLGTGWWLRADPVHLRPDRDQLVLFGSHYLALNEIESQSLARLVAPLFTEYGWQFEPLRPNRWYLQLPQPDQVTFTALGVAERKHLRTALPTGIDGSRWRSLLNETQMLLHDCTVNQRREDHGLPPANSLWFWGAGESSLCSDSSWQQVSGGHDPLFQALANYCKISNKPLIEFQTGHEWLEEISAPGNYLLILDSLLSEIDSFQHRQILLGLEENWFSVLFAALRNRRLASLTLYPMDGYFYYLAWPQAWYFWRRSRIPYDG